MMMCVMSVEERFHVQKNYPKGWDIGHYPSLWNKKIGWTDKIWPFYGFLSRYQPIQSNIIKVLEFGYVNSKVGIKFQSWEVLKYPSIPI